MLRLGIKTGESIFLMRKGRVIGEIIPDQIPYEIVENRFGKIKGPGLMMDFFEEPDEDGVTILRGSVLLKKKEGPRLIADFREGR